MGFALLKNHLDESKGNADPLNYFILSFRLLFICFNDEIIYQSKPTVKEFYAEDFLREIKEYIDLPTKRVPCCQHWDPPGYLSI